MWCNGGRNAFAPTGLSYVGRVDLSLSISTVPQPVFSPEVGCFVKATEEAMTNGRNRPSISSFVDARGGPLFATRSGNWVDQARSAQEKLVALSVLDSTCHAVGVYVLFVVFSHLSHLRWDPFPSET